jgi:hypothetical protein
VSAIARTAVDRTFLYRHRDLLGKIHATQARPRAGTGPGFARGKRSRWPSVPVGRLTVMTTSPASLAAVAPVPPAGFSLVRPDRAARQAPGLALTARPRPPGKRPCPGRLADDARLGQFPGMRPWFCAWAVPGAAEGSLRARACSGMTAPSASAPAAVRRG